MQTIKNGKIRIIDTDKIAILDSDYNPLFLITTETAEGLKETISQTLTYLEDWTHTLNRYKNFSSVLETELDEDEKLMEEDEDFNEFNVGGQYHPFVSFVHENDREVNSNNDAADILKEGYEKEFGTDHGLIFDPEHSFCYIYTKDREEAKKFKKWVYKHYVYPSLMYVLNTFKEGAESVGYEERTNTDDILKELEEPE